MAASLCAHQFQAPPPQTTINSCNFSNSQQFTASTSTMAALCIADVAETVHTKATVSDPIPGRATCNCPAINSRASLCCPQIAPPALSPSPLPSVVGLSHHHRP
ncbi:hypothetical protein M0R45_035802 [Rubus argutus]|uniref:Uncharacterized protein n=1 Tax=Rubus argutus TaxID=59490 RepID=A0AAW1VXZ1_RUBAR